MQYLFQFDLNFDFRKQTNDPWVVHLLQVVLMKALDSVTKPYGLTAHYDAQALDILLLPSKVVQLGRLMDQGQTRGY